MNNRSVNLTTVLGEIARLIESVNNNTTASTNGTINSTTSRTEPSRERGIVNQSVNEATTSSQPRGQNVDAVNEGASTSRPVSYVPSPLPSGFRPPQSRWPSMLTTSASKPTRKRSSGIIGRIRTWNKDVVCLPYSRDSNFPIPRGKQRGLLAERGLIGKIRIVSSWNVAQVKEEVTSVFGSVFNLQPGELLEYEYLHTMSGLKRLKRPSVSSSFTWNGSEVASLAGQGSLYILANKELPQRIAVEVPENDDIDENLEDENNEIEEVNYPATILVEPPDSSSVSEVVEPSTSSNIGGVSNQDMLQLQAMFPFTSEETLGETLQNNLNIDFAIDELLSNAENSENPSTAGVFDIAEYFNRRLTGEPLMLSVNRDSIWRDAFMFYKGQIDATRPLRIVFAGDSELGVDGGGPRREFFQLLVHHLASLTADFFEGTVPMLLPVMKGPALRLRHFRIVGTIIAHSIVNGGIGFPCLARPIYEYIVTQNIEVSLIYCEVEMVTNIESRDIINEIKTTGESDFSKLANRPDFLDYVFQAGWTGVLLHKDREHLVATLLLHEIIWKREAAINQIMQGLALLDVLDLIRRYPNYFRAKFVLSTVSLTSSDLLENIIIAEPCDSAEQKVKDFFVQYIEDNITLSCGEVLQIKRCPAVVQFVTGQQHLECLPGKILVRYLHDTEGNFPTAGTCGLNMYLPIKHENMEEFARNMDKAFECELFGFPCY